MLTKYSLRALQSKVIEHIFECVTVELDMKQHIYIYIIVSCIYRTPVSDLDIVYESIEQLFTEVTPNKSIFW